VAVLTGEGFDARAIEGATSQYDVVRDGTVVFSKQERGRFPEPDEIVAALRAG
jgi:hypothetical protein